MATVVAVERAIVAPGGCQGGYYQPRISVWAESLYLQATDVDVAHAQQQNGIGGAGTVPFGDIGTVEMEYESGARIGASVGCSDCAGILFSWTYYETEAFADLQGPAIPGGGGAVGSLVHHPGTALTASIGPVDAFQEIDFQLADIVYHRILRCGHNYYVGVLAALNMGIWNSAFADRRLQRWKRRHNRHRDRNQI